MTTTTQQLTQGSLRLRPASPSAGPESRRPGRPWSGTKPVSARFALLAQYEAARWAPWVPAWSFRSAWWRLRGHDSAAVSPADDSESHVYGDGDRRAHRWIFRLRRQPKPPAPPKVKVQPPPPPVEKPAPKPDVAKYLAPPKIEAPKPKPRQVEAELPKVNDTFQPVKMEMAYQPAGASARTCENRHDDRRQLGGANDRASRPSTRFRPAGSAIPTASPGPSDPNKRANIGQFGNPALPPGPGYGNGTGGANGSKRNCCQHRIW